MGPDAAAAAGNQAAGNGNEIEDAILSEVAGKFGQTIPTKKPDAPAEGGDDDDGGAAGEGSDDDEDPETEDVGGGDTKGQQSEEDAGTEGEDAGKGEGEGDGEGDDKSKPDPKDQQPKPGDEYAAETAQLLKKRLKDLPEPTRKLVEGVIGGRISTIVAKERAERDRLGARVEELTAQNTQLAAEKGPRYVSSDIHPTLLLDSEKEIGDRVGKLQELLDWAEDHADGVEPTGEPGDEDYKPGFTKDQIRAKAREWRKEKEELIPQAREKLRARAAGDAALKEIYPALFDAKSPEHQQATGMLAALPQLRRFANMNQILAAMIVGLKELERMAEARGAAKGGAGGPGKTKTETDQQPRKKAPRAPGGGSPAKGSDVVRERGQPVASEAVKKVMSNPGDKKAFTSAIASLVDI